MFLLSAQETKKPVGPQNGTQSMIKVMLFVILLIFHRSRVFPPFYCNFFTVSLVMAIEQHINE